MNNAGTRIYGFIVYRSTVINKFEGILQYTTSTENKKRINLR
jgi:hypothetical protein